MQSAYAICTHISGAGQLGKFSIMDPNANTGIVCFITVAGFLNGPGFEKMRDYLRRTANDAWVIDCSPQKAFWARKRPLTAGKGLSGIMGSQLDQKDLASSPGTVFYPPSRSSRRSGKGFSSEEKSLSRDAMASSGSLTT